MQQLYYKRFALDSTVAKYGWVMENEEGEVQQRPDLLIADGCPEIIFVLEGAYRKYRLQDRSHTQVVERSCIVGIQAETLLVERIGKVRLVGIKFKPLGFYRLLGERAVQAAGRNIDISDFGESWIMDLNEQLTACSENGLIPGLLDNTLARKYPGELESATLKTTEACLQSIIQEDGNIQLKELATRHGKSARQIQRYFKAYFGVTPKQFINIIRFKALYKDVVIDNGELSSFFDFGYYDQTHFIKDFKAQLGITPSKMEDEAFREKNEIARKSSR